MEGVAQLLVAARAIFFFRLLRIEHTAERIVPAAAIGDDASQHPPHIGIETVSGRQPRGVLSLEGIRQVQALAFLGAG